jgi:hypothetical protein
MSGSLVVLKAGSDHVDGLRARFAVVELVGFAAVDVLRALEAISLRRPSRVVLEQAFASTSRGTALVNRLRADPALRDLAVDVVSAASPAGTRPAAATAASPAVVAPAGPLDVRGTRQAPRTTMRDGLDIVVDGAAVRLVNLSVIGAQVVSAGVLKPNQKVRVSLVDESGSIRTSAIIVWASYELPRAGQPRAQYRAGLAFLDANAAAVGAFQERHARRG